MLRRLSLSLKLRAMIVVPVAGLILFAGMDLKGRLATKAEMTQLEETTRLGMLAHEVASMLRDERSLTAGALAATGTVSDELQVQYGEPDPLPTRQSHPPSRSSLLVPPSEAVSPPSGVLAPSTREDPLSGMSPLSVISPA